MVCDGFHIYKPWENQVFDGPLVGPLVGYGGKPPLEAKHRTWSVGSACSTPDTKDTYLEVRESGSCLHGGTTANWQRWVRTL